MSSFSHAKFPDLHWHMQNIEYHKTAKQALMIKFNLMY